MLILEPVVLVGEGEYNLDNLKEVKVVDSYLGMDQDIRDCQIKEPLFNCTTRLYIDTLKQECGCIPLHIKFFNEVRDFFISYSTFLFYSHNAIHHCRIQFAPQLLTLNVLSKQLLIPPPA